MIERYISPKMTAHNPEEGDRIGRLKKVYKSIFETIPEAMFKTPILEMRDHKGTLLVLWETKDTPKEVMDVVAKKWDEIGCETTYHHLFLDKDCGGKIITGHELHGKVRYW